ncbi:hypothetical protein J2W23_001976 [Variovorax boronicumulans]|uniref:hypothetical protein n=1 Tax=Variovorax boronicumulans TaxID=436515 RepID=UPI0027893EE9|nr:hypothetical protein [Variovorax boronicumulans]MDQ0013594.1 hypothetical protein [Variovorax boronicumulans]
MKSDCPHCKKPGITGFAKRWSNRAAPATCEACGGLCHVLASTSSGIWAAGVLIVLVALIAAIGLHSAWLFSSGLVLAIACNLRAWKRARLWPISKESAAHATTANWFVTGIAVLLGLS